MSKSIKIDDATYSLVAEFAGREDRPLSNAFARLVKLGLSNSSVGISASGHSGTSRHTPLKDVPEEDEERIPGVIPKAERIAFTKDELHTVTIPSVDTSQPRESTTPHKRWVPTTPEELEAELEKVRRGEREA